MRYFIPIIACVLFFNACKEENNRVPEIDDPVIPGPVSNIQVERLAGALKFTYDIPPGQSLSYVRAECLINGVLRQVKASSYVNSLTINGFADTSVYTVNFYSVNRSEKASDPVAIQAKPLSPNFQEVFKTMELMEDWGGATASFENPNEADLAIVFNYVDSIGFWNQGETFYTKMPKGSVTTRGFAPRQTTFGVYVRDRWNNATDTLFKTLTPRFEKMLDRLQFKELRLPGDATLYGGTYVTSAIWDGRLAGDPCLVTNADGQWPHWVNFDLGVEKVLLSRFTMWQRGGQYTSMAYSDRNIKRFEIWGSMNPTAEWDSWTLLLDGEMIKPSGLPLGSNSEEDMEAWRNGHEFTFPLDIPYVKYIRLLVKETWSGLERFQVDEVEFWGQEPSDIVQ